ncbi:kirola-like [Nicotiana tabacum]|uniref:Kirola-like n=2 Tax=Nicotiana TaxID=4085 RepID=A0A1S4ADG6_TOBAC|nr:PREDICTED: kirola-like [Nicotiana sylvestris]XP_016474659.1 PREDICTED: kirola-like [Nicotiana tabacum]
MGLKGKLISQIEIKGCGDLFHEMFRHKPHHLPNVTPDKIQAVDLHEGDWGTVGSVVNWNYTIEGQTKVVKVVVEAIDEEKRLVTFSAFEGHLIEQYKTFKATVHIENEGENNLVLWTIEYEKQNDEVSEPFCYLEFATNLTKEVDAHHVNQ